MTTSAELQVLDRQSLQDFQLLYSQNWPKYCQEYNTLNNFITYFKEQTQLKDFKVYTLTDERAQQQGLFLIVDRYQLFVGCLSDSLELLAQALHLLDWSGGLFCSSIPARYIETIQEVVHEKRLRIDLEMSCNLYHLPVEQAQQFPIDCPQGFQLKSLDVKDAQLIDQEWPYSQEGSLYFIQRQIRTCPSMGLYDEDTKKLIAWCIRTQDGLLATLQVRDTDKRRGFGNLIVRAFSQRLAALGEDIAAEVLPANSPSANLFLKLGFQVINNCHWLITLPVSGPFTWPKGQ